ncbi:MAG: radical SAM protein, partial [Sphingomonadaceae bacterium]|nr:radical SAM protein [Sphingomonadaceae bacterium]
MWTYQPRHLATQAPRYTSYPTAAEFGDAVGAADQARALATVAPDARLSIYVHVPYCQTICWYCGCNTGAANRPDRLDAYADALHAEIAAVAGRLAGRGSVDSIHFGGGSPNILPAPALAAVISALRRRFPTEPDVDIAVEVDPRSLDAAYIDGLAAAGVTRVSLGVQTFSPRVQAKINRIQPFEMVAAAVAQLRAAGIGAINFDLMYGLPGQMAADVVDAIDRAVTLAPDRIAVFGYAHLPAMLPRQRMIADADLPGAVARFAQARVAHQRLVELGYVAIGFDHFARPDDPLALA